MDNSRIIDRSHWLMLILVALLGLAPALAQDDEFSINQGISGAWFDETTPGQGFLIDVDPSSQFLFVAWFTFDAGAAKVGAPEHRWLTAQGNYSGGSADLELSSTSGGRFDDPQAVSTVPAGSLSISFSDCETGTVSFDLTDDGLQGEISIKRVIPGTGDLCASGMVSKGMSDSFWTASGGPSGGSVTQIHRHDTDSIFAIVGNLGALHRSTDNGQSWERMPFQAPNMGVVVDLASDGSGGLYLVNACNFFVGCSQENGIYRSTDDGESFELIGGAGRDLTAVFANGNVILVGDAFGFILRSLNDGASLNSVASGLEFIGGFAESPAGTLFAASPLAIYRSTNNGGSWSVALELECCNESAVAVDSEGRAFAGSSRGVFRSTDDGQTWSRADNGIPVEQDGLKFVDRISIGNNDSLVVRAGFDRVFRSTNAGDQWSEISDSRFEGAGLREVIHAGDNTLLVASEGLGVFRSTNTGASWNIENTGILGASVDRLLTDGSRIYADANGNLFRAENGGATWTLIDLPDGLSSGTFGLGAGDRIYAAGFFLGQIYRSDDDGASWTRIPTPWDDEADVILIFDLAEHPDGSLYASVFDNFLGGEIISGVYRTADNGDSWTKLNAGLPNVDSNYAAPEISRIEIADDGSILAGLVRFSQNGERSVTAFRSTDGGESWQETNVSEENIYDFAFAPGNTVYTATNNGLFRSGNGGESWNRRTLPSDGNVRAVAVTSDGELYVAEDTDGALFSTDRGDSFTVLNDGLPDGDDVVQSLAVANGLLYAGTRGSSVYRSRDAVAEGAFAINQGMFGAWLNGATPGQGFLFDIEPSSRFMFVAWFTYDAVAGKVGSDGQRWLTAQGNYDGDVATLDVSLTSGGAFNDDQAVSSQPVGTLTVDFDECGKAALSYDLDEGLSGSAMLTRLLPSAAALCESLQGAP